MRAGRVESLRTRLFRVPLVRAWGTDVESVHLLVTELRTDDGITGTGFSWTPSIGGHAVHALLQHDIADHVVGRTAEPAVLWDELWRHLHEGGPGGLTTMAMAAVDIALWDAKGHREGRSLADLVGRRRRRAPVYGSGVNFHYGKDELVEQAERWIANGITAVKIKVGHDDIEEDVERVAAVRAAIGERTRLMVDANQRWDLPTAVRAIKRLAEYDLHWVEEPLLSDDLDAHLRLRARTAVPIAIGETLYTAYQFNQAIADGICDYVQPNIVRVGGVTPFLRIASAARIAGAVVAPHLLPDISAQLAVCLPEPALVEDVEDASFEALGVLSGPSQVAIDGPWATVGSAPGHGLTFAVERLEQLHAGPVRAGLNT